ncbi:hypothetical protein SO802_020766 [Lithocarpus litseifolius]|uniref:RING-type E3 ubiquitin transferase n=1 Tax=Lithocarpus litseifolius TaxID=425828 RepID=A0AAW2CCT8_9ROSI
MSRRRSYFSENVKFRVWQESQPRNQPPSQCLDGFPTEIYMLKVMRLEESLDVGNSHDDEPPSTSYEQISLHRKSVWLAKHEVLLQDNGDRLSSSLCDFDIPVENHDPVLQEIASVAGSAGTSRMPIVVILLRMVKLVIEEIIDDDDDEDSNEEEELDSVILDSMETYEPIPATKCSIKALEKVRFQQGLNSVQECIICMEEFHTGSEVNRMPCSHIYHGDCIVRWLETSHICPLCRYPMPHDDPRSPSISDNVFMCINLSLVLYICVRALAKLLKYYF